jgi:hypothetical protein
MPVIVCSTFSWRNISLDWWRVKCSRVCLTNNKSVVSKKQRATSPRMSKNYFIENALFKMTGWVLSLFLIYALIGLLHCVSNYHCARFSQTVLEVFLGFILIGCCCLVFYLVSSRHLREGARRYYLSHCCVDEAKNSAITYSLMDCVLKIFYLAVMRCKQRGN